MVHYKLFYFPVRGRGEAIRHLFLLSGTKYEMKTITMEEWPQYKPQMPLGQMPVLEVDGTMIAQTVSILRFLGHQFHRAGNGPLECAKLDMIAEVLQDMGAAEGLPKWGGVLLGFIPADKDEFFREKVRPAIEQFAPIIERFLIENGNNGLLVGDKETWVDVFAAECFVRFRDFGAADALSAYPHINQLINRIHNVPAIKNHIAHRQPTPI